MTLALGIWCLLLFLLLLFLVNHYLRMKENYGQQKKNFYSGAKLQKYGCFVQLL